MNLRQLRAVMASIPFNASLGIRVARVHADGVTIECPVRDDLRNRSGVLHGGVSATLADVAVGVSLSRHFGNQRPATTAEMKINYFRPVAAGKLVARARLLRVGSHLCVGQVDLFDAEKNRVGVALVTYMLLG